MSSPTRIRVLNLGMQTVALAEFHTSPDGSLTLDQLQFTELLADPGADASRPGQLEVAIAELKKSANVTSGDASYALPSQSVFARYLSLPVTTADDLNQIIAFEAQQNVPFPIDEVVWDYQPLGQPVDSKLNVVLLAIKTDTLEAVNKAVETPGFTPQIIDVAPMSLLNAFHYSYPQAEGCSLVIDIGARTTNLLFVEGDRSFSRSIPVGGNTITAAIAKEFHQPIEAAELMKKEKGFVSLGGAYADPEDEVLARISKLARTTLTRLHAEIARSISFYRANQHGTQPLRIYLAGGAVSMPYMLEFFSEKLQIPVEFFNPFSNVIIGPTVDADLLTSKAHAAGEVVGLALRELGNCPIEINLRPPTVVAAQTLSKRKPYLIAATACLFLLLAQCWVYFSKAASVEDQVLQGVNADISKLDGKARAFDDLKRTQDGVEAIASPLLNAAREREIWADILDELSANLPARYIWITKLSPLASGKSITVGGEKATAGTTTGPTSPAVQRQGSPAIDALEIHGLYFDNPNQTKVIDEFVKSLEKSDLFAIDASNINKVVTEHQTADDQHWAYPYT
ncbi:MAG: type IV pilus assembly protein PilM, partial [Chthoniobacterales bacterium]